MSALAPAGLGTVLGLTWRTRKLELAAWVLGLGASMAGTASSISATYDSPAKIQSYADAVTGGALQVINGHVEGINTLGGVIQDEFGFLASFLLPLMGIALVARGTRREEESGRWEVTMGGGVDRRAPMIGALSTAAACIGLVVAVFTGSLTAVGVSSDRALLYSMSLGALALVFTALAAAVSHLVLHARGIYAAALGVLVLAYVLRGIGDVTGTWLTWLSPLGWAEKSAAFGPMRWWTLLIPVGCSALLVGTAVLLSGRRDLGGALVPARPGHPAAGPLLRTTTGLVLHEQRSTLVGWLAGSVVLAGMFGSLAQQLLDALAGNPDLARALGAGLTISPDGIFQLIAIYSAVIVTGMAVHLGAEMRSEEISGRLELLLAGSTSRRRWFASYAGVMVAAVLATALLSALVASATASVSLGSWPRTAATFGAAAAYVPAELVLGALALAVFGLAPRLMPVVWLAYAVVTFVAFLGDALKMPSWATHLAPTSWVGTPPVHPADAAGLVIACAVASALGLVGCLGFLRRQVPMGSVLEVSSSRR